MKKAIVVALNVLLVLAGFGSAAAQTKAAADWKTVVEAAKREGTVKCACPPRRDFALAFKKALKMRSLE